MGRIIIIAISIIVFFSSVSSGLMFYRSLVVDEKLKRISLIKLQIEKKVKNSSKAADQEKERRLKVEKTLLNTVQDLGKAIDEKNKIEEKLEELKSNIENDNKRKEKIESVYKQNLSELENLKDTNRNLDAIIVELRTKLKQKENDVNFYKNKSSSIEKGFKKISQAYLDDKKKSKKLTSEVIALRTELSSKNDDGKQKQVDNTKLTEANALNNKLKTENTSLREKLDKLQTSYNTLQKQLASKDKQISALKTTPVEKKKILKNKEASNKIDENKAAKLVQTELKRIKCYSGEVDGIWGSSSQLALKNFRTAAKLERLASFTSPELLKLLKSKQGKFCNIKKEDPFSKKVIEACLVDCEIEFNNRLDCRQECYNR